MKVLIAEDEPVSRHLLLGLLTKWGYEVISVKDGNAAWECLARPDAPHLALLDWMMPGQNGTQVCAKIRNERPDPYTYVILLTAKDAKEAVIEGLDAGADDYLTKPFHPLELQARLRVGLRLLGLEDRLVQAREGMRYKATHDILTGSWNRGTVLEEFERELNRVRRERLSLGVVIGDMDHFKRINDTFGHLAGDSVLREVTRRLQSCIRPYDAIGRYGGEEFLILLPGCNDAATGAKAEQLRNAVVELPVETASGQLRVSMSFGGVTAEALPGASSDQLLQMADAALYQAKAQGRNRVAMAARQDTNSTHQSFLAASVPGIRNP